MEKIWTKTPWDYSASFLTSDFSIWLWERPEDIIAMIWDFFDVPMGPKTNYFIFGDTRTLQIIQGKSQIIVEQNFGGISNFRKYIC